MNAHIIKYPAYVFWDVTGECNHKCFYCYNYWRTEKTGPATGPERDYADIADFIISKKPAAVTLSGGEPLLVFGGIAEQIKRFCAEGICVRIYTNGSLITEEIADFCKEYGVNLMVSFPSADRALFGEITNCVQSYDRVIRGMDLLRARGVPFSPNVVVTKLNIRDLAATAQWLIDHYHPYKLFISRVTRPANASEQYDRFALGRDDLAFMFSECERIKDRNGIAISGCGGVPYCIFPSEGSLRMFGKRCGAGKNGYCIDMGGNVRACSRDDESLGNVFSDGFDELREKLAAWGDRNGIPEKCKGCGVADECRGGCRMNGLDNIRGGRAVDCDADPGKAPTKLPKSDIRVALMKKYRVPGGLKRVDHEGISRVAHMHYVVYLEKRFADCLMNNGELGVFSVAKELKIPVFAAKRFIAKLISSGVIKA